MFQAIVTRYIGASNHKGSRVKATAAAGTITLGWLCELNVSQNHTRAAKVLAEKMEWDGFWVGGGMPEGSGCVYVRGIVGIPASCLPEEYGFDLGGVRHNA